MRKSIMLFFVLFTATPSLYAQIEGIPDDSVSVYLAIKWDEKARFLNTHQVEIFGDAMAYEFKQDHTYVKHFDNKVFKGSWAYDSTKKVVQLLIDGKVDFYIVAMTKNELLFSAELPERNNKGLGILVLLKTID